MKLPRLTAAPSGLNNRARSISSLRQASGVIAMMDTTEKSRARLSGDTDDQNERREEINKSIFRLR
jgi:hypothetical protein